jgi:hypothetical protein
MSTTTPKRPRYPTQKVQNSRLATRPSTKYARCGKPTCSGSSRFTRQCCRSFASRRTHASSMCRARSDR